MSLALLLVDPQNDFFPGGSLAVPGGDAIVEPVNRALRRHRSAPVFVTRCWHPESSAHFQAGGGPWPPHCVQGTHGAAIHAGLDLPADARVFSKGTNPDDDAGYSGFEARDERGALLGDALREAGVDALLVAGLATDYCVKATVESAQAEGFQCFVLLQGIRPVELTPGDGERALEAMKVAGAWLVAD